MSELSRCEMISVTRSLRAFHALRMRCSVPASMRGESSNTMTAGLRIRPWRSTGAAAGRPTATPALAHDGPIPGWQADDVVVQLRELGRALDPLFLAQGSP